MHFVQCALVKILFFGTGYSLQAQVSDPSSWESFVNSSDNTLVSDTFRLQTFGDSEWDNWGYSAKGGTQILDVSSVNIDKLGGKMGLRMPLGSSVRFEQYIPTLYSDVTAEIFYGGNYLNRGNNLSMRIYTEKDTSVQVIAKITDSNIACPYNALIIPNTPLKIDFFSATGTNPDSYYCLQYAFASGTIPTHSLFTGTGNWNDTIRWSHLPPLRHRSALIKGNVSITADTYCNTAAISSGNLQINPGTKFMANHLELFEADASIQSGGAIAISDCITVHKTFEETGKWYFISFPFDVYPSGIDSRFNQKDGTPNAGGNFLYVQCYNGDKRASANRPTGNWEVVPVRSDEIPIFEKNKGYLIALDSQATDKTLSFSSRPGDIPEDFANTGTLSIPLATGMTAWNRENYGWYLCGNPLPAPLPLSQIEENEALDGYVYVYSSSGYTAYPLNGDYALPPFSAFFVKASSETHINVSSDLSAKTTNMIRTNAPLAPHNAEPAPDKQSTGLTNLKTGNIHYFIKDRQLYLQNIPEPGYIKLTDISGSCLLNKKIREGSASVPVSNKPGIYILQIETPHFQKHYKVILP